MLMSQLNDLELILLFTSRRRHTSSKRDWSSDVFSSDLTTTATTERVADAWIDARSYQLYTFHTLSRLEAGGELGPESSVNKLFRSEERRVGKEGRARVRK